MTALYILMIIFAVFAVIALIPVRVTVLLNMEEQEVTLRYAFLKFILYPRPKKEAEEHEEAAEDQKEPQDRGFDIHTVIDFLKGSKDDIKALISRSARYFARHGIKIRELNISSKFGTGDPAYTGMLCGAAYTAVYNAIGFLDRNTRLLKWSVNLTPDFDSACFSAGLYTQLSTNAAHFIIMLFGIIKYVFRIAKNISGKQTELRKEQDNG